MKAVFANVGFDSKRHPSADGGPQNQSSGECASNRHSQIVEQQVTRLKAAEEARKAREDRLATLIPFCIDATLVECLSSGQELMEDKLNAFKLLTKCGLKNIALAAFCKETAPDLKFLHALRSEKLIDEHCFAFSELFDANGSDLPGQDLPFGLAKMIQFGIQNAILECDLAAPYINWNKYSTEDFCALVESRCRWVAANLYAGRCTPPATFVHLRDFATAMQVAPGRVLELVEYLGRLDPNVRPRGILVHEPAGGHLPFEAAPCVAVVRAVMDSTGWTHAAASAAAGDTGSGLQSGGGSGLLLVHVTAGYGLAHATVLECLSAGCCGVMASLCEETETSSSHASSLLDLVNLSRLGNPHVAAAFNIEQLRVVAREMSAIMHRAAERTKQEQQQVAAQQQQPKQQAPMLTAALPSAAYDSSARQPLILGHA